MKQHNYWWKLLLSHNALLWQDKSQESACQGRSTADCSPQFFSEQKSGPTFFFFFSLSCFLRHSIRALVSFSRLPKAFKKENAVVPQLRQLDNSHIRRTPWPVRCRFLETDHIRYCSRGCEHKLIFLVHPHIFELLVETFFSTPKKKYGNDPLLRRRCSALNSRPVCRARLCAGCPAT